MRIRSPKTDPQPGDRLRFGAWTISVIGRNGDCVTYKRSRIDLAPEPQRTQDLSSWCAWASGAHILERGATSGSCLVFRFGVSGPCARCRQQLHDEIHVVADVGALCPSCCDSAVHQETKRKEKAA